MKEIWKDIPEYEGLYQVSNYGNVKSLSKTIIRSNGYKQTFKERKLKPRLSKNGYLTVMLFKNKEGKTKAIHKLVAKTFILNNKNKRCVNHKDENKLNNCVDNLEWCSYKYNNNYGTKNESKKVKVNQYDLEDNFIKTWDCISRVEKQLKINHRNICLCCKNKRKSAGGYKWKYYEEFNG